MHEIHGSRENQWTEIPVLIVGAGPTGLVLALWLTKLGVKVRIIDRTPEPGTTSRAMVVHARTLELHRQVGLADAAVAEGVQIEGVNLWGRGKKLGRLPLGRIGQGLSRFPFALGLPQDVHERLLIDQLAIVGVQVERRTELLHFEQDNTGVHAVIRRPDGSEERCFASYLAGCDGAHSTVRGGLGISLPGGTYQGYFYVADVVANGPMLNDEIHVNIDDGDFLGIFPMRGKGRTRLIGVVNQDPEPGHELTIEDVQKRAIGHMQLTIEKVNWFSTYHVHHRVADYFSKGRAFLLGDAAHLHSPVGGQGMNTGIGDAVNLSWKLAQVLQGAAENSLLDTYQPERIAFARKLVATTDRVFTFLTRQDRFTEFIRVNIFPWVLSTLLTMSRPRRFLFRAVSQIGIQFRFSPLSEGSTGRIHGGDRLPWVPGEGGSGDNFEPLNELNWQVHVYGEPAAGLSEACAKMGLSIHVFPWSKAASQSGLKRGAVYLVRPDCLIALAELGADGQRIEEYFRSRGLSVPVPHSRPSKHMARSHLF